MFGRPPEATCTCTCMYMYVHLPLRLTVAPAVQIYPEYYIVIKQPIDLKEIHDKIKNGVYSSVEGMMTDVQLLVSNACTFNEEESLVYTVGAVFN